jgi:hypothetical protein
MLFTTTTTDAYQAATAVMTAIWPPALMMSAPDELPPPATKNPMNNTISVIPAAGMPRRQHGSLG